MMVPRAAVCADRIAEVLDTETSVRPAGRAGHHARRPRRARAARRRASATRAPRSRCCATVVPARPGETTAIIGSTGAGKTTLLNLVPRLFDVTGGAVLVDGVDVRDLDPDVLWSRIGLVPQKPYLFTGTVRSNLQYGKPDATDEELWHALEVAQARDFVEAMPEGLDAPIAQGGTNVSGGQRQRLAIARALVRRPRDLPVRRLVLRARLRHRRARCGPRSSPRPPTRPWSSSPSASSTIRDADQIVVLEDGAVVGRGPHEELLETSETYQEIVESQLSEEEAA